MSLRKIGDRWYNIHNLDSGVIIFDTEKYTSYTEFSEKIKEWIEDIKKEHPKVSDEDIMFYLYPQYEWDQGTSYVEIYLKLFYRELETEEEHKERLEKEQMMLEGTEKYEIEEMKKLAEKYGYDLEKSEIKTLNN